MKNNKIHINRFMIFGLVGGIWGISACCSTASGCSVPVFRYALERWQSDRYVAQIDHRQELSDDQKSAVETINNYSRGEGGTVTNVYVNDRGISNEDTESQETVLRVNFPMHCGIPVPAWTGKLTKENAEMIVNSPARKEIAERLVEGDSAVWILLESGDSEKDDDAEKLLNEQLKKLENELQLPEEISADYMAEGYDPSLTIDEANEHAVRIRFSTIRVSRDDPKEEFLVSSLLRTESDLLEFDEPMTFAVFGRARILLALIGKGINEDNIEEICTFLSGPCSCTVKGLNPGVDMLVSFDWDKALEGSEVIEQIEMPPLTGLSSSNAGTELEQLDEVIEEEVSSEEVFEENNKVAENVAFVVSGLLCFIASFAVTINIIKKKKLQRLEDIERRQ